MIQLNSILVATDFSAASRKAFTYGVKLAREFQAVLHVLNVQDDISRALGDPGINLITLGSLIEEQEQAAERELRSLVRLVEEGVKVRTRVLIGTPLLEIIRYARGSRIDLIVMGTHGRTGLSHLFLGSVAEAVVRQAPCPVLTVRDREHELIETGESG